MINEKVLNNNFKINNGYLLKVSTIIAVFITSSIVIFSKDKGEIESYLDKTTEIIRYHIIGKSDNEYDQEIKMKLKEISLEVIEEVSKMSNASSKDEYEMYLKNNVEEIENKIYKEIEKSGDENLISYMNSEDNKLIITLEDGEFPLKYYDNTCKVDEKNIYDQGIYTSLKIQIGKGEGHNFWQILYPSMNITEECYGKTSDNIDNTSKIATETRLELKILKLFK